ncbi:hypothetical protein K9N68_28225 [Kovacikia minuta CCNUW1]|uniref:hypothetical protein n=1 Tax=Kovacikia minuta TaxID=2931930 RepID=UPI001CCDE80D|nr:hypothetical protein [Kovacikia minuta]UBF25439.1 hypothetical protein K9N68_28225 [Kovacikia minuta CCNUW1]
MSDHNTLFLQTASTVINKLDACYGEAAPDRKVELKEELDRAVMNFSETRCKILENEVHCTAEDVARIQTLLNEVEQAREIQAVQAIAIRVTQLLASL